MSIHKWQFLIAKAQAKLKRAQYFIEKYFKDHLASSG